MKPTTAKNITAIFRVGANEIDRDILSSRFHLSRHSRELSARCRITGRTSRPINGFAVLYRNNLTDLWVWTDQRNRSTQSVHARVNLKDDDALAQLEAAGVEILALNPDGKLKKASKNQREAERFVRSWQGSSNIGEVARELGIRKEAASMRASQYRKKGIPLKRFSGGPHSRGGWPNLLNIAKLEALAKSLEAKG